MTLPETTQPLNATVCVLLLYFAYVFCSAKSECLTVTKKQILNIGKEKVKRIYVSDGRHFDVWNGFSAAQSVINLTHHIRLLPRLNDKEFSKIKTGHSYIIKHYSLLLTKNRFIWSIKKSAK